VDKVPLLLHQVNLQDFRNTNPTATPFIEASFSHLKLSPAWTGPFRNATKDLFVHEKTGKKKVSLIAFSNKHFNIRIQ